MYFFLKTLWWILRFFFHLFFVYFILAFRLDVKFIFFKTLKLYSVYKVYCNTTVPWKYSLSKQKPNKTNLKLLLLCDGQAFSAPMWHWKAHVVLPILFSRNNRSHVPLCLGDSGFHISRNSLLHNEAQKADEHQAASLLCQGPLCIIAGIHV